MPMRRKRAQNNNYSESEINNTRKRKKNRLQLQLHACNYWLFLFSAKKKLQKQRLIHSANNDNNKKVYKNKAHEMKKKLNQTVTKKWNENENGERLALAPTLITFVIIVYDHFSRDTTTFCSSVRFLCRFVFGIECELMRFEKCVLFLRRLCYEKKLENIKFPLRNGFRIRFLCS